MNFRKNRRQEEPEINFIPLIDLLLVILIFLMVTTTYDRLHGIKVRLPAADAAPESTPAAQDIFIAVNADGWHTGGQSFADTAALEGALAAEAARTGGKGWVIVHADADIPYRRITDTLAAAQNAGLTRVTLATVPTDAAQP